MNSCSMPGQHPHIMQKPCAPLEQGGGSVGLVESRRGYGMRELGWGCSVGQRLCFYLCGHERSASLEPSHFYPFPNLFLGTDQSAFPSPTWELGLP